MDERWLSTSDAGRELRRSPRTARRLAASGRLTARRFGRAWWVQERDLAEFMRKSRTGADTAEDAAGAGRQAVCGS
jgi:excisionase family DNA binding protein